MTPIPDYKPTKADERYEGARKVGEYITFALVMFLLFMGLGAAALVGDELQACRVEKAAIPANEYRHSWADHPGEPGSINVWRKLDGQPEVWE